MGDLLAMYEALLSVYGPQGWWPLLGYEGSNPTKTGRLTGYHVGLYDFPRTPRERVEICVGAILTQNTAWANVEKALVGLEAAGLLLPESILEAGDTEISEAIRPSGYFNVKARKLRELALFLVAKGERTPTRSELLSLWGIGPETADSILLYAYSVPEMVVDTYTRRVFSGLGLVDSGIGYDALKAASASCLPEDIVIRQEFHALIVEHAKQHYSRRPYTDPVLGFLSV